MAITTFAPSPAQRQQKLNTQKQVQNLQKQGWGEFGEQQNKDSESSLKKAEQEFNNWNAFLRVPEPQDIKIEFPLTVKAEPETAVATLQKQEQIQEERIDYDIAEVLEAEQQLAKSHEFSASGSMPFNIEAQAVAEVERITQEHKELHQEQTAAVEEVEITFSESANKLTSELENNSDSRVSQLASPLIEDTHTREPQEFMQNDMDLVRHHSDVDFPYFFGWVREQLEPATKILSKTVLSAKQWVDTKVALFDDLLLKNIFGFGEKKPLSKEDQLKKQTQVANKRSFFDALRAGAAKVTGAERRRNLKSRLENLNRSLKRSNLSYEGDLDENGQIRESSLIEEELANSKKSDEQLLAEKKKKMMMAGKAKAKSGPGITMSADKSHNFNNAAKLAG